MKFSCILRPKFSELTSGFEDLLVYVQDFKKLSAIKSVSR